MIKITFLILPAFLMTFSLQSHAAGPAETVASFHAALASGDKTKAMELLAPAVTIFESGYVESSRDKYASHHLSEDIAFARRSTRKVLSHQERIYENCAVLWEETETSGESGGKPVHSIGTETTVLEKKGDQWSIVHVHWSSRKLK